MTCRSEAKCNPWKVMGKIDPVGAMTGTSHQSLGLVLMRFKEPIKYGCYVAVEREDRTPEEEAYYALSERVVERLYVRETKKVKNACGISLFTPSEYEDKVFALFPYHFYSRVCQEMFGDSGMDSSYPEWT